MIHSEWRPASRLRVATHKIFSFYRTYVLPVLKWAAVVAIVVELGGIWNEVHHIRDEQVKNEWYALPVEAQKRIEQRGPIAKGRWESSSNADVQGSVSIDNQGEPVEVQIENEPVEVEMDR